MRFSDTVILIAETIPGENQGIDANGIQRTIKTPRELFGDVRSVSGEEIRAAELRGIKALCRVDIWRDEYRGELLAEVEGRYVEVYRTFATGEKIELYMGEKVGMPGG